MNRNDTISANLLRLSLFAEIMRNCADSSFMMVGQNIFHISNNLVLILADQLDYLSKCKFWKNKKENIFTKQTETLRLKLNYSTWPTLV